MNYLESFSENALTFITTIISLLIGLFVSPLLDLAKTKIAARGEATDEANRLKTLLNNQLYELLDAYKANHAVCHMLSLQNKTINNLTDAYELYRNLGPAYQVKVNLEFNEKGIYTRILRTIDTIEQTNYYGWSESSEKLRYLKQLNHVIHSAVNTPKSHYAENVLELVAAFQNADAHSKHIVQRLYVWLRGK